MRTPFPLAEKVPHVLKPYLLDFWWDMDALHHVAMPSQTLRVSELETYLDLPFWEYKGKPFSITPREVWRKPEVYREQYLRTMAADLRYPIVIYRKHDGRLVVMDGIHRLLKAHIARKQTLKARVFSDSLLPLVARRHTKPIRHKSINGEGVVGELYFPNGGGLFPGVVCIGGSSGGTHVSAAPLLAEAGFAALSLGYFGAPGLPESFANLPLEYFVRALDWLLRQPMIRGPKVGVLGSSRGSEAALQLATLTPKVGGVAAYVPSGIRWMGIDGQAPWTYHGVPLPYVGWANEFGEKGAIRKVDRFNQILDNPRAWAEAEIAIEQASCPLLLISGKDDQLWPSQRMANLIVERLKKYHYPFAYRHISYADAGHRIKVPGLDASSYEPVSKDTVTGELLQLGGSFEGNKVASEQAWKETVGFFRGIDLAGDC